MSDETDRDATATIQVMEIDPVATPAEEGTGTPSGNAKPEKSVQLPNLNGKYKYIKTLCVSQRPYLGKIMADHSIAMFSTRREIHGRTETQKRFDTTYIDKHDVDEDNKGKEKSFIINSLRSKQPLNHSKKVKNDSRCTTTLSEITTKLEKARSTHETYKTEMSGIAKEIAELEIKARKEILCHQYCEAALDIGEGLYFIGKKEHGASTSTLTPTEASLAAYEQFFNKADDSHWLGLPFLASVDIAQKKEFFKQFEKIHKYNHTYNIEPKVKYHDQPLIDWLTDELDDILPTLTTKFWEEYEQEQNEKRMDAELALHFGKKNVKSANNNLSNGLDTNQGQEGVRGIAQEEIQKEKNKRVTKNKKKARKNSSGGDKNQEPEPTENGKKQKKKSKKKQNNGRRASSKRRYEEREEEEEERDHHHNRRRHNNHHNSDRGRSYSRGRPSYRPRERSVSWGQDTAYYPPRGRYTRRDSPRRNNNASYHDSRTQINPNWRRGRSRDGRGGRGGYRSGRGGYN